jgi:hypothetical protein
VSCPDGTHRLPDGKEAVKAVSTVQGRRIPAKFRALNPYDPTVIPDLLKIEKVNFDSAGHLRQITGYAISAKRYAPYQRDESNLTIIEPKAHELGYLSPQ